MRLKQQRRWAAWCRSNDSRSNKMGSLRRRTGDKVEPRRANHDAVNRTALHRSAWRKLGGADRFGCRWRIPSAVSLVDHGWTIRREISECFSAARRRLRRAQAAMAGLRPDVLLCHALQWRWWNGSQDHVLRSLQVRASLEISDQTRETGEI